MDREKIMEGVRLILDGIGEDVTREGLLETHCNSFIAPNLF